MRKVGVLAFDASIIFALTVALAIVRGECVAAPLSQAATMHISAVAAIVDVPRIGMNLGSWTYYGAEQFSSNVLMNPGFEPTIDRAIVVVHDGNSNGFSDDSSWLGRPDNFWNGGTFQVRTGRSAGIYGSIASSRKSAGQGLPWFSTVEQSPTLAPGDVISVIRTQSTGAPANWWIPGSSTGYVAINSNDRRPGSPGRSVAQLTLRSGQPTEVVSYLDSMSGTDGAGKFLPVNGPWRLSFWSRAVTGTPTISLNFARIGPMSSFSFVSQTVTAASVWRRTVIDFTASDTGPAGTLALNFSASGVAGSEVRLDDVVLERLSDAPGAFRAEVTDALRALHPSYLRDWQSQLGDTLANRLAGSFARSPSRYRPDSDGSQQLFLYSLPDFLALCARVGAQPWVVVPTTFYDSELAGLGTYLAQAQATYHFSEIVVEFGNENWNSDFRPAGIEDPAVMGQLAERAFSAIRRAAGPSVPLHFEINGQFVNPWIGQRALAQAPDADAIDVGSYFFHTLRADTDQSAAIASMMTDDESLLIAQLADTTRPLGKDLDVYEVNLSTTEGNAPEAQRTPLIAGSVSGTALARRMILAMNAHVRRQCVWSLSQYDNFLSQSVGYMRLFGVTRDLAVTKSFRPTGLAVEMLNEAIGGDFHPVTVTGAVGLTAAAFLSKAGWSLAIASSNSSVITVAWDFPTAANAPTRVQTLLSISPTTTNELQQKVEISRTGLADGQRNIAVPAYGLVVLLPAANPS
ncbi:MAG TPA: hypothetical protein VGG60_09635 [Candidatus Binataceae bacterium]